MTQPQMQEAQSVDIFSLEAPKVAPKVTAEQVQKQIDQAGIVKIKSEVKANLDGQAETFLETIKTSDPQTPKMKQLQDFVRNMGASEIKQMSQSNNSFLSRPVKALKEVEGGSGVANTLLDLRKVVEELDPNRRQNLWSIKKMFSWVPGFNKVDNYFKEYQSSQTQLNAIIESLYGGKDALQRDNAAVEVEKADLWENMGRLEQFIYVAGRLSEKIEKFLPELEAKDAYKAKVVKEDILFYLKQREIDLRTNMAVHLQSYMSLGIVQKNNEELIKGVDRACDTTLTALRVAIMVSTALGTQKLVLDQINSVNKTTEQLILNNAKQLNQQGVEILKQASSATIDPKVLEEAFKEVVQALDSIDKYKSEAITSMTATIENLSGTIDEMKKHVDKNRAKELAGVDAIIKEDESVPAGVININRPKV